MLVDLLLRFSINIYLLKLSNSKCISEACIFSQRDNLKLWLQVITKIFLAFTL